MQGKIKLLKSINTDNSRFILKIVESFEKNKINLKNKENNSSIITNCIDSLDKKNVINLDKIWSKPYFYTTMRLKFNKILEELSKSSYEDISRNPKKFCNDIVKVKVTKNFNKPNDCTDIVDFIQNLNSSNDYVFFAKEKNEETLFKEDQIKKAIHIIHLKDKKEQFSYIYDEIYNYLDEDFISNKYCDFINDKCIAQRHLVLYPMNRKDGCCFMQIRKCNHLHEHGDCDVKCLACRLFSCPYLSKKGVGYWASDFVLLKAFLNKSQRKQLIFDFYKDKNSVLEKVLQK